jgi:hypothetical protein
MFMGVEEEMQEQTNHLDHTCSSQAPKDLDPINHRVSRVDLPR